MDFGNLFVTVATSLFRPPPSEARGSIPIPPGPYHVAGGLPTRVHPAPAFEPAPCHFPLEPVGPVDHSDDDERMKARGVSVLARRVLPLAAPSSSHRRRTRPTLLCRRKGRGHPACPEGCFPALPSDRSTTPAPAPIPPHPTSSHPTPPRPGSKGIQGGGRGGGRGHGRRWSDGAAVVRSRAKGVVKGVTKGWRLSGDMWGGRAAFGPRGWHLRGGALAPRPPY
jgi:hypothetical protein